MNNNIAIKVENLSVAYRDIPALWDISIKLPKSKLIAIVGPNGAGKSTLLKAILGLIKRESGTIEIFGNSLSQLKNRHKQIAYIPQRGSVDWDFPINCLDVVMMGRYGHLGWFNRPGEEEKEMAMDALTKFGMEDYHDRLIGELSGGQKQRVFLARAYVQQAELLALDEPFGGVDTKTENMTLELLKELREEGKTIIVITHDLQSLKDYFDLVLLINTQKIAYGKPEEVLTQENLRKAYGGLMHMIYDEKQEGEQ